MTKVRKKPAKSARSSAELSYEEASGRLEEILGRIEEGQVGIDELSGLVKEAAELVAVCRKKIRATELQVMTITEQLEREASDDDDEAE